MKKNKRTVGLKERLAAGLDTNLGGGFFLEMRGKHSLSVSGCIGIAEYGTEQICLRLRHENLKISGKNLLCDSYTNGAVLVSGDICGIELTENRK